MDSKRIALVVGASGLVGRHLIEQLVNHPSFAEVRVLGRRPPLGWEKDIEFFEADLLSESFPRRAFISVTDIFCTIGTTQKKTPNKEVYQSIDAGIPIKIAQLGRIFKARHFLVVSSISADVKSRFFYFRTKGLMEEGIISSGMPVIEIFRPSTLLGHRGERRFGEWFGKLFDRILGRLLPARYRGIHAKTVARAMILRALDQPFEGINVWESEQIRMLAKHAEKIEKAQPKKQTKAQPRRRRRR